MAPRRLRFLVGAAAVAGVAILVGLTAAAVSGAAVDGASASDTGADATGLQPSGQVRLGHLSPSTPAVDVYIGGRGRGEVLAFREAVYGTVSAYVAVPVGRWTVALRAAGTPADNAASITIQLDVTAGGAGSLLLADTGPGETVRGRVIDDAPGAGRPASGRVRLLHGAPGVGPVDAAVVGGPDLAEALDYGESTDYSSVDAGDQTVRLDTVDGRRTTALAVADGSVTTMVLTRDAAGELSVVAIPDEPGGG